MLRNRRRSIELFQYANSSSISSTWWPRGKKKRSITRTKRDCVAAANDRYSTRRIWIFFLFFFIAVKHRENRWKVSIHGGTFPRRVGNESHFMEITAPLNNAAQLWDGTYFFFFFFSSARFSRSSEIIHRTSRMFIVAFWRITRFVRFKWDSWIVWLVMEIIQSFFFCSKKENDVAGV